MKNNIFKNKYFLKLIILMIISFAVGLSMIISPETINHWVIRSVGLIGVAEAISYALKIVRMYIESKI